MKPKVEVKENNLVITIPLQPPHPVCNWQTLVVASTHGNQETDAIVNGKPVVIGVNAYIRR